MSVFSPREVGFTLVMQSALQPETAISTLRENLVSRQIINNELMDMESAESAYLDTSWGGDGSYAGWVERLEFTLWPTTPTGRLQSVFSIAGVIEPHDAGSRITAKFEFSISPLILLLLVVPAIASLLPEWITGGVFIFTIAATILAGLPLLMYGMEYFSMINEYSSLKKFFEKHLNAKEVEW